MSLSHVSGTLAAILGAFGGQFGRPTFRTFVSLVVGWLLCSGRHTVSRVIVAARSAGAEGHHARFYRFLSKSVWREGTDALGRIVLQLLLPLVPSPIELIVDDTLCRKGGPQIFGAAMHHDAVASSYGGAAGPRRVLSFGHDWVVLSVRVPVPWSVGRAIAVPLLARLYRGKKRTPPAQYRKRTQMAREMLEHVLEWLPQDRRVRLLGDSEYACRTLVRTLPERVAFVGPVVMKAALCELAPPYSGRGRPAVRGRRLPSPQLMRRAPQSAWTPIEAVLYGRRVKLLVQSVVCLWWTVAGQRAVRVVLARDPSGRYRDRAFFATDPTLSAAEILALFSHRWDLEVTFRDLKRVQLSTVHGYLMLVSFSKATDHVYVESSWLSGEVPPGATVRNASHVDEDGKGDMGGTGKRDLFDETKVEYEYVARVSHCTEWMKGDPGPPPAPRGPATPGGETGGPTTGGGGPTPSPYDTDDPPPSGYPGRIPPWPRKLPAEDEPTELSPDDPIYR